MCVASGGLLFQTDIESTFILGMPMGDSII